MSEKRMFLNMKLFYFFAYFGFGGLFPLLSVYLQQDVGLRGSQIGVITSIGPIVMILIQPVWGMLSDVTKKPRLLLTFSVIGAGAVGFSYLFVEEYAILVAVAAGVAVFQSAMIPLSDSMAMSYVRQNGGDYGSIRMWGAAGFAVSVWLMGTLSDLYGMQVIFYGFFIVLLISAYFAAGMPKETETTKVDLKNGLKKLTTIPEFMIFLVVTFLVFGPIMANNFYFGLLIQFAGGTLAGVGLAFLLAAGSEIPFMRVAGNWISRMGILGVLLIAAGASAVRWLYYGTGPSHEWIYVTTIIQGLSIGLFVPAALQYVSDLAPAEVKVTAVAIYSAMGNGVGAWFFSISAGMIMEWSSIVTVYTFYGVMSAIGALLTLWMIVRQKKYGKPVDQHETPEVIG